MPAIGDGPSGAEDDDPLRQARAYNQSIYLMVGMPYLLLGAAGLLIYRGVKKNQAFRQAAAAATAAEDASCPSASTVATLSPPG